MTNHDNILPILGPDAQTLYDLLLIKSEQAQEKYADYVRMNYQSTNSKDYALRKQDETWIDLHKINDDRRHELIGYTMLCYAKLTEDIIASGIPLTEFEELYRDKVKRIAALPIIAQHVQKDYPDQIKSGMAALMNIREADPYVPMLVEEMQSCANRGLESAMAGLAEAISVAASSKRLPVLAELALDRTLGTERRRILRRLRQSKPELFKGVLSQLRQNGDNVADGW